MRGGINNKNRFKEYSVNQPSLNDICDNENFFYETNYSMKNLISISLYILLKERYYRRHDRQCDIIFG